MTKVFVCLEVGAEGASAFAPRYEGCWVFGRTQESAIVKIKIAITDWFKWMEKHGERFSGEAKSCEIEVGEMMRVGYNPVEAGKPEPLFWSEVAPITKEDITRALRLMQFSREDLRELTSNLDKNCLDWPPPEEPRTIRNCLRHIAYVEPWYISRLDAELPSKYPRNVFEMLDYTRKIVVDYLTILPREKKREIFQPQKDQSPVCNLWTARKVLRRLVDHERMHTKYIAKVIQLYRQRKDS